MDNCNEEPPGLQASKGSRSPAGNSGIDFSNLYRIPIWRGGNLAGLALHRNIGNNRLYKHKIMDLGIRKDDEGINGI